MGREAQCAVTLGKAKPVEAKVLLETAEIVVRGALKLKIPLAEARDVTAKNGALSLSWSGGTVSFALGDDAGKWAKRILSPPGLMEKLGVKAGQRVALVGRHDPGFAAELAARTGSAPETKPGKGTDLIFLEAKDRGALAAIPKLKGCLSPAGALWVLRPKGVKEITERDVMDAGRDAGLKDVKVAAYSATITAEKFVIPVADRKR